VYNANRGAWECHEDARHPVVVWSAAAVPCHSIYFISESKCRDAERHRGIPTRARGNEKKLHLVPTLGIP